MNLSETPWLRRSLYLLLAATAFKRLFELSADFDLWGHTFFGKEILRTGEIVAHDQYSFTAPGAPFINHEWLAEVVFGWLDLNGGETSLFLLRATLTLGILAFVGATIAIRTANPFARIVTGLLAINILAPGVSYRPQLISYFLLSLLIYYLERLRKQSRLPKLPLLFFLFALWANLHGAFVVGLVVLGVYLGECATRDSRPGKLLPVFIAALVGTCCTPFTLKLWTYIFHEITNPYSSQYITEWARFSFEARELPFLLGVLIGIALFVAQKAKLGMESILFLLGAVLGFASVRHSPLLTLFALPLWATGIGIVLDRIPRRSTGRASPAIDGALGVIVLATSLVFAALAGPIRIGVTRGEDPLPVQSVGFLKANRIEANLWVPLHWGSYSLYHLSPRVRVSIDGRWATVYPREVMKENLEFSFNGQNGVWREILNRHQANFALVEKTNPAVAEMGKDAEWVWLVVENSGGLLARRSAIAGQKFQRGPEPAARWAF